MSIAYGLFAPEEYRVHHAVRAAIVVRVQAPFCLVRAEGEGGGESARE
jgi:hypothetical protein